MIQAIIQLEKYPCAAWIIEQFARARDQIIVIEQAGIFLRGLVAAQHRLTDREKRHAGGEDTRGSVILIQHLQTRGFVFHQALDFGLACGLYGFRREALADSALVDDENAAPRRISFRAAGDIQRQPFCHGSREVLVRDAAALQRLGRLTKRGFLIRRGDFREYFSRLRAAWCKPKLPRQRSAHPRHALALLHGVQQLCAATRHGADHFGKLCWRLVFRQNCQGRAIRLTGQQRIAFARQQRPSILFLHHRELRRQARFQRKGAQQGLRETMQG